MINNAKVNIYPGFTMEVHRLSFLSIQGNGIKYALQIPTTFRLMHDVMTIFCTMPEEAWNWLECKGITSTSSGGKDVPTEWTVNRRSCSSCHVLGPSKEQAAKDRAQVIVEEEQRMTAPRLVTWNQAVLVGDLWKHPNPCSTPYWGEAQWLLLKQLKARYKDLSEIRGHSSAP
ncbi:hypothetical protein NDU88_004798 [Pleurodeles waltl]|uniref:Uncharacterized protein n=1 Tax=Pleurodeles waltl TaxID=8319 RepID=A0AAV7VK65_PLEWA|nr:hypothetical protein NDU88_004798 [Pleurodeles waltl]